MSGSTPQQKNNEAQHETSQSVSELLVAAREGLGRTQKDVADELFLTISYIKHIDAGDFEKIPKPAFIKGYLRSYARSVSLSGDEIVKRYEQILHAAEDDMEIRGVTEETVGSVKFTGPVIQTGLVGLFGVIVVIGMVWWIASSGDEQHPEVTSADPAAEIQNAKNGRSFSETTGISGSASNAGQEKISSQSMLSDPVLQESELLSAGQVNNPAVEAATIEVLVDEQIVDNQQGEEIVRIERQVEQQAETARSEASIESPIESPIGSGEQGKDVRIERYRDGDQNFITLDAGGFDEMEISFVDECWLEIEDGDGQSIYGDLNRPGDVLRVYGIAPFELLFGRATGVTLKYNGEEVNLVRYIGEDETAKVRLGQP